MHRYLVTAIGLAMATTAVSADRVLVPGGSFQMGCSPRDSRCEDDEGPPGGTAVTVAEYRSCMEAGV